MSADERIEELLNRANNTIMDLPKAQDYDLVQMLGVTMEAIQWCGSQAEKDNAQHELAQYACHLADIIDRLEWALNNMIEKYEEIDIYE